MRHICIILLTIILFVSCDNSTNRSEFVIENADLAFPITIDIDGARNNQETMILSSYTDKISYVKLKTPQNVFIKTISDVQFAKDRIYIHEGLSNKVMVFDMAGNYIRSIGKIGRGPNEYIVLKSFCIDESNKNLLFYTGYSGDIFKYNAEGEFIEKLFTHRFADFMYYFDGNLIFTGLVGSNKNMPDDLPTITITDLHGNIKSSVPFPFYSIENWRNKTLWFGGYSQTKSENHSII